MTLSEGNRVLKGLFSREVEDFAIDLADSFSRRCPPAGARGGGLPAMTVAKAVDEVCNRAADFQRSKRLGMFRRAKLGTEFKLKLGELGYDKEFVSELTTRVLMKMSRVE
jgi:hypothetical protein